MIFESIILGIVQGLTEFFPVSSSGHLVLIPHLLGWQPMADQLTFDIGLHLGSLVALIFCFKNDWQILIGKLLKKPTEKPLVYILIATLPAMVVGFLLSDLIDTHLRTSTIAAFNLIIFGILLLIADYLGKKNKTIKNLKLIDALIIGIFQVLSLAPGVSRSGITISAGLFRGLSRVEAVRFSFLIATPTIAMAGVYQVLKIILTSASIDYPIFLIGIITSAITSFITIKLLLKIIDVLSFKPFVVYRLTLGLIVLLLEFLQFSI